MRVAEISAVKEFLYGPDRQDGKRPDGLTVIPRQDGRSLIREPVDASYVDTEATHFSTVANRTAAKKIEKYLILPLLCVFQTVVA